MLTACRRSSPDLGVGHAGRAARPSRGRGPRCARRAAAPTSTSSSRANGERRPDEQDDPVPVQAFVRRRGGAWTSRIAATASSSMRSRCGTCSSAPSLVAHRRSTSRTSARANSRSSFGFSRATPWNRKTSSTDGRRSIAELLQARRRSRRLPIIGCRPAVDAVLAPAPSCGRNVKYCVPLVAHSARAPARPRRRGARAAEAPPRRGPSASPRGVVRRRRRPASRQT